MDGWDIDIPDEELTLAPSATPNAASQLSDAFVRNASDVLNNATVDGWEIDNQQHENADAAMQNSHSNIHASDEAAQRDTSSLSVKAKDFPVHDEVHDDVVVKSAVAEEYATNTEADQISHITSPGADAAAFEDPLSTFDDNLSTPTPIAQALHKTELLAVVIEALRDGRIEKDQWAAVIKEFPDVASLSLTVVWCRFAIIELCMNQLHAALHEDQQADAAPTTAESGNRVLVGPVLRDLTEQLQHVYTVDVSNLLWTHMLGGAVGEHEVDATTTVHGHADSTRSVFVGVNASNASDATDSMSNVRVVEGGVAAFVRLFSVFEKVSVAHSTAQTLQSRLLQYGSAGMILHGSPNNFIRTIASLRQSDDFFAICAALLVQAVTGIPCAHKTIEDLPGVLEAQINALGSDLHGTTHYVQTLGLSGVIHAGLRTVLNSLQTSEDKEEGQDSVKTLIQTLVHNMQVIEKELVGHLLPKDSVNASLSSAFAQACKTVLSNFEDERFLRKIVQVVKQTTPMRDDVGMSLYSPGAAAVSVQWLRSFISGEPFELLQAPESVNVREGMIFSGVDSFVEIIASARKRMSNSHLLHKAAHIYSTLLKHIRVSGAAEAMELLMVHNTLQAAADRLTTRLGASPHPSLQECIDKLRDDAKLTCMRALRLLCEQCVASFPKMQLFSTAICMSIDAELASLEEEADVTDETNTRGTFFPLQFGEIAHAVKAIAASTAAKLQERAVIHASLEHARQDIDAAAIISSISNSIDKASDTLASLAEDYRRVVSVHMFNRIMDVLMDHVVFYVNTALEKAAEEWEDTLENAGKPHAAVTHSTVLEWYTKLQQLGSVYHFEGMEETRIQALPQFRGLQKHQSTLLFIQNGLLQPQKLDPRDNDVRKKMIKMFVPPGKRRNHLLGMLT